MHLQTILNHVERYKSFVYGKAGFRPKGSGTVLEVNIEARPNGRPVCSGCGKRRPGYDRLPAVVRVRAVVGHGGALRDS